MYKMAWILILFSILPNVISVEQWDMFIFTQEWPPAVCILGELKHHKCSIPNEVKTWIIHGLWPTKNASVGPTCCNESWPFSVKPIKDLLPEMKIKWPNMLDDTPPYEFWEHEWTKHGTCATSVPTTANEHKYFSTTLKLNDKYDASKLLNKHGIIPSKTASYNYTQFMAALSQELDGAVPLIQCLHDESTNQHVIFEIEICLDKLSFAPVNCYPGKIWSNCVKLSQIYYPPIPGVDPELVQREAVVSIL